METIIEISDQKPISYGDLQTSVERLFNAYLNYVSKEGQLELGKAGFVDAFNKRISQDIYAILNSAPELITEFLIHLIQVGVLKSFKDNFGTTIQNAIVISSMPSNKGNYHDAGISDIFVVGNDRLPSINFYRTNLQRSKTLPPNPEQIMTQKISLDTMDGTVDTSEFLSVQDLAEILKANLSEGKTITFSVERVIDEPSLNEEQ